MSIAKVKEYFKQFKMDDRIQEFNVSSATVELGDAKVDNKKFKEHFQTKAKMLIPEEVRTFIGHEIGGVCPFAINNNINVYLDNSLKRFTTIFPACGSSNSAIELTIEELEKFSNYTQWVDVCKLS